MPKASRSKYKKVARLLYEGESQAQACLQAGVNQTLAQARKGAYLTVKNETVVAELERLEALGTGALVQSKKEKLEDLADLQRDLLNKIRDKIDDGEKIDVRLIDALVKLGKRDDTLQGHNIQAEVNPQDKADETISDWTMEARKLNKAKVVTEVINIESE